MRKMLSFVVSLCIYSTGYSQEMPKIIPPSPNAASLGKYAELPVSMATGIPNISIPLYTVQEGSLSLPIGLSYYSGGLKVEEIASWVGLGWSLNAGGVLSRTTVGLPDESMYGYMKNSPTVQYLRDMDYSSQAFYDYGSGSINGYYDFEPDIFTFNIGGVTGRFFYDQSTNKFVQTPRSNIKIDYVLDSSGDKIDKWILTTPDGIKYYMGKSADGLRSGQEQNSSNSSTSYSNHNFSIPAGGISIPDHYTSWYVMDIVSPNGESIKFSYNSQIITQLNKTSEEFVFTTGACSTKGYSASFSQSMVNQRVLSKIEFPNGYIDFVEDTNSRLDLSGSKALKSINVYANNQLIKQFDLDYSYTISNIETGHWTSLGNSNMRRYRLRLESVTEKDKDGNSKPSYTFTYNSLGLPSRFSNAQDFWGYYNGDVNTDLIPKTKLTYIPEIYVGTAERTVNPATVQAGVLTKITYPTGGTAEYFYESNTSSSTSSHVSLDYNMRNRLNTVYFDFVKAPANVDNGGVYAYSKNFTIGTNVKGPVSFSTTVTGCDNSQSLANLGCDYLIKIIGLTDSNYLLTISSNQFDIQLPAGNYKIVALDQSANSTSNFSVIMNWGEDPHPNYLTVGGLRVYKTKLTDGNGNTIEKNYDYSLFGQTLTSGYIISTPDFLNMHFFNGSCSPTEYAAKITSYSQMPSAFINGNVIGYSNVTETNTNGSKTAYTYSSAGDYAHFNPYGSIHLPDLYINWIRGVLLKKEDYLFNGTNFIKVKSLENEYERISTTGYQNIGFKTLTTISGQSYPTFEFGFYSGVSEYYRLKKSTTTSFYLNDSVSVIQNQIYNNNPLLASEITTSNSKGETLKTTNYYPQDKLSLTNLTSQASVAIDSLIKQHRITEPIQVEMYKNDSLLSLQRTNYKDWGNSIVLPQKIQTSKGGNSLEDRVVYHSYDNKGNPTEVSKKDGTHVVYIWGYHQSKPIAKIENVTYAQISGYVSNLQAKSDLDVDAASEDTFRSALDAMRSSLAGAYPNAQVTTFTYDPLIGVTCITDPRGKSMFYTYDAFNRLYLIKDDDGNIVKRYEYHYKN